MADNACRMILEDNWIINLNEIKKIERILCGIQNLYFFHQNDGFSTQRTSTKILNLTLLKLEFK